MDVKQELYYIIIEVMTVTRLDTQFSALHRGKTFDLDANIYVDKIMQVLNGSHPHVVDGSQVKEVL